MLPTQVFAPGVQTPTHAPAEQMLLQAAPRCQLPFPSQVSGVFMSQRRSPGMQSSPIASAVPPPVFLVLPSGLLEPAAPAPPVVPPAAVPPRPVAPNVPALPEIPASPDVPDTPDVTADTGAAHT